MLPRVEKTNTATVCGGFVTWACRTEKKTIVENGSIHFQSHLLEKASNQKLCCVAQSQRICCRVRELHGLHLAATTNSGPTQAGPANLIDNQSRNCHVMSAQLTQQHHIRIKQMKNESRNMRYIAAVGIATDCVRDHVRTCAESTRGKLK